MAGRPRTPHGGGHGGGNGDGPSPPGGRHGSGGGDDGNGGDGGGRRRRGGDGGDVQNVARAQETTAEAARQGRPGGGAAGSGRGTASGGPPWPVADGTAGPARGKSLNPPHPRHTVDGSRSGEVKPVNSVILRGQEQAVRNDVAEIAAGHARWNPDTQRYEINGRSYGVEPSGRVYPDSGPGVVKLDRNEYAALKEIAKAGGDPSRSPALSRDPRFVNNPGAVAKAKAIYDGTYQP